MSSSVCHAPLPARMEAFTARICLRAVDQYERLLQTHFHKKKNGKDRSTSPSSKKEQQQQTQTQQQPQQQQNQKHKQQQQNNHHPTTKDGSYSATRHHHQHHHHHHHQRKHKGANGFGCIGAQRSVSVDSTPGVLADSSKIRAKIVGIEGDVAGDSAVNATTTTTTTTTGATTTTTTKASASEEKLQMIDQFPSLAPDACAPGENLAIDALDLTEPTSEVQLKNRLKSWFQLSGHPDGIAPAGPGTVWKRRAGGADNNERAVYQALSKDKALKDWIPRFYREVEYRGDSFMELQDLLFGFDDEPHVVDIKLGTRTFLESEVTKTAGRPDLYEKMIAVDPEAPSPAERASRAVTKLRYMQFREQNSSSRSHGFRVEAMKLPGRPPITDLKKIKSHEQVVETMRMFLEHRRGGATTTTMGQETRDKLLAKLRELRTRIEESEYFLRHEVIGSSIFMIFDKTKVGVWLIDFQKTCEVPEGCKLTHRRQWEQGNHEDGLLFGLDKLISVLEEIQL